MSDNTRCTTEYRELISGYIDGDLDAADRTRLLAHLATCAECRMTLESYRRIGGQVRSLPRAVPPPELREEIYAQTINSNSRKVYLLTSRLGYSVAALAAVMLIFIVAIYLLVNGYQRSIDPAVVASEPGNGMLWPLSRPVEISFNKEMNHDSVEAALSVVPASERDRLTISWDGNTMVLGQNQTLHSASSYTILITTNAEDKWGKNLGSAFRLQFETSDSFALQTPEPLPTATATVKPTEAPTASPTPVPATPTASGDEIAPVAPAATTEPTQAPAIEPTSAFAAPTATVPPAPTASGPSVPAPTATPVPAAPTATEEPAVIPSATATARPTSTAAPTWTPRPIPTATATASPSTATPTEVQSTATPATIPVVGAFGNVYWTNEIVLSRLGEPTTSATTVTGIELDFQHGAMFSRSDTSQTYVLESATGVWSELPSATETASSEPGPVPDTWIPGGSLGTLWGTESWIQSALGYALAPSGTVFDSSVQSFEHGSMLKSSSGQIYVIYADGTWELYPDPGA